MYCHVENTGLGFPDRRVHASTAMVYSIWFQVRFFAGFRVTGFF